MKAIICDKCKKVNPNLDGDRLNKIGFSFDGGGTIYYDLCNECKEDFLLWLRRENVK